MNVPGFALKFSAALVDRDFAAAHMMLAEALKPAWPATLIQREFEKMVAGERGLTVEVIETLSDWPDRKTGDIGWVYVAINGANLSEAVAVVVAQTPKGPVVREIVWGRP